MLAVEELRTYFSMRAGVVKAVDGVSFTIRAGEIVGLVGESGSGKTNVCLSILRLVPQPAGRIVGGTVCFAGRDLLALSEQEFRRIRGRDITMILQDPQTALNPVFSVGNQVAETFRFHDLATDGQSLTQRVVNALRRVQIPSPESRLRDYPHQFSGGMRQRVMAAMAVASAPKLLIADEPTTALDVTIQAQFLDLIRTLRREANLAVLYVTHDLGVVAQLCDRVLVMYAGRIVESGDVTQIFQNPGHPYTRALIESVPVLGQRRQRLYQIEGQPPNPLDLPSGCPFHPRCPRAAGSCREKMPDEAPYGSGSVRCFFPG